MNRVRGGIRPPVIVNVRVNGDVGWPVTREIAQHLEMAGKTADSSAPLTRFQRIRSAHRAREGPGSKGSPKYWVSRATLPSLNSMMLTV
jgi:hypothetical protein